MISRFARLNFWGLAFSFRQILSTVGGIMARIRLRMKSRIADLAFLGYYPDTEPINKNRCNSCGEKQKSAARLASRPERKITNATFKSRNIL